MEFYNAVCAGRLLHGYISDRINYVLGLEDSISKTIFLHLRVCYRTDFKGFFSSLDICNGLF